MELLDVLLPVGVVWSCCLLVHLFSGKIMLRERLPFLQYVKAHKRKLVTGAVALAVFSVMSVTLLGPIGPGQAAEPRLIPFKTITDMMKDCIRNGIIDQTALQSWNGSLWGAVYVISHSARNLIANVALFFPIGFLLGAHIKSIKWGGAAIISVTVPVFVELWQLLLAKGRTCDVDDIILNFIGIFLGFAAVIIYRNNRSKNGKRNNRRNK